MKSGLIIQVVIGIIILLSLSGIASASSSRLSGYYVWTTSQGQCCHPGTLITTMVYATNVHQITHITPMVSAIIHHVQIQISPIPMKVTATNVHQISDITWMASAIIRHVQIRITHITAMVSATNVHQIIHITPMASAGIHHVQIQITQFTAMDIAGIIN